MSRLRYAPYVVMGVRSTKKVRGGDTLDRVTCSFFTKFFPLIAASCAIFALSVLVMMLLTVMIFARPVHGRTFDDFRTNVREEPQEYAALFTLDGTALLEMTSNSKDSVYTPAVLFVYANIIGGGSYVYAHNHLNDLPHSTIDIIDCMRIRPTKAVVIGQNHTYSLRAALDWPTAAEVQEYLKDATEKVKATGEQVSYCSNGEYLELFNYPEIAEDFLERFGLIFVAQAASDT